MNEGYVKSFRAMMEKPWYKKSEYFHLWHHLLFTATHKEMEFFFDNKTIILKPGQLITGRKSLSKDTGINESKIERCLNYFEKNEHQIEQQKTNKNRLITILNWEKWQGSNYIEQQNEQQLNNKRTTTEQQMNTNKNDKKVNNDKTYNILLEKYFEWFKLNNDGVIPKMDGAGGNALKSIITYLRAIFKEKAKAEGWPPEFEAEKITGMWAYILNNWGKQDNFLRGKTRLIDINSNIQNIIEQLKHGKRGAGVTGADIDRIVDSTFGK
jgi:hypothetical protein